jgi:hypothetical protein
MWILKKLIASRREDETPRDARHQADWRCRSGINHRYLRSTTRAYFHPGDGMDSGKSHQRDDEPARSHFGPERSIFRLTVNGEAGKTYHPIETEIVVSLIFWVSIFFLLFMAILFHERIGLEQPEKLLIAVAIWSTAVFAHFSVLLPFIRPYNGLDRYAKTIFTMIVGNGVVSFVLGGYYFDLAVHGNSDLWINIDNIKHSMETSSRILNEMFSAIKIILGFHTLIFVLGILVMDFLIYKGASSEKARKEFWDITIFIDGPMVLGIAYTTAIGPKIPSGEEYFVAGAVALQLFVANIQLLLFRAFGPIRLLETPRN